MAFEFQILDYLQTLRTPFLDTIVPYITHLASGGALWVVITIILLYKKNTRKTGMILLIAILLDLIICNGILKNLFMRTRPYLINTNIELLVPASIDYSFPSGHTAISFACSSVIYLCGYKKQGFLCFILSMIIGLTRMYLYVHYPTDVLGGIVIGLLCGYIATQLYYKYPKYFERFLS